MEKILGFRQNLPSPLDTFINRIKAKRDARLEIMKSEAVNVTEFDGELCLAVNGVPIFPIGKIGIPYERLQQVLQEGRDTWAKFQNR